MPVLLWLLVLGAAQARDADLPGAEDSAMPAVRELAAPTEFTLQPNVLSWATASEKDNFGYDVYRSLSKDGPFAKINQDAILAAGTTDLPQRYKYIDAALEPNTVYWYYVESISFSGDRIRVTPVYAAEAKVPHRTGQ